MKEITIALFLVLLCCVNSANCAPAKPQPSSFEHFVQAAEGAGTDDTVRLENWKKAVEIAEKGPSTRLAYALVHYGDALAGSDNEEAVAAFKRGVELRDKIGATQTLGMVRNLLRYGMMQQHLDIKFDTKEADIRSDHVKADEAKLAPGQTDVRPPLSRALDIAQQINAPEAFQFSIMVCLESAYYNAKQYDEAEKLSLKMIELSDRPKNPNANSECMAGYSQLLLIYSDTKRWADYHRVEKVLEDEGRASPDAAQIKAMQNVYLAAEKLADESEERAFKGTGGPSHR